MKSNLTLFSNFWRMTLPLIILLAGALSTKAQTTYCVAANTDPNGLGSYMSNITFGTINNTTGTTYPTNGYEYFPSQTTTVVMGSTENLSVTITTGANYSGAIVSVWFDWNQDGVFSASEWTQVGTNILAGATATIAIPIPTSASPGLTRMRVRSRGAFNINGSGDACLSMGSGDTEDYDITVSAGAPCSGAPNAGSFAAGTIDSICPNIPFNLSISGFTFGTGMVYQWQSASSTTGPWNDITGATNPNYISTGISATTYYRFRSVCNSGTPVYSPTKQINLKAATDCYCTPTYTNGCSGGAKINNFSTTGASTNISNLNSGCSTGAFGNFTAMSASVMQGVTFNFSATITDWDAYVKIWVDWNQDGVFDATTELVSASTSAIVSGNNYTGTITIPMTAIPGNTRMRVRAVESTSTFEPCTSQSWGEAEDYTLTVVPALPCTNPPAAGTIAGIDSVCANTAFTLNASGLSIGTGIGYQWQSATAATGPWTDIAGATGSVFSSTGITVATHYRVRTICSAGTPVYTPVKSIIIKAVTDCYCIPTYVNGCTFGDDIKDVTLVGNTQTLSNLNTPCATGAYTNYFNSTTLSVPDLMPTVPYNGTVTTNYSSPYEYVKIWIDFNNDGVFDVATEEVANFGPISNTSTGAYTMTLPATVSSGLKRMRVMLVYGSAPVSPCGSYSYGETHDYKVNVLPLVPCTNPPAAGTISVIDSICPNTSFDLTSTGLSIGGGLVYQWQSAPATTGPWTNIAGANGSTYVVTAGITAPTFYRLESVCNTGTPVYSNIDSVMLNPATDCYCAPTYSSGCAFDDDIKDVTLVGATQTLSNLNTPCPASGYEDYTNSTTLAIPDLIQGLTYSGTVTTNYTSLSEYVKIWIDYNNDGTFDIATEEVAAFGPISDTSIGAYSITIPTTASAGYRRMRVVLNWNASPLDPCGSYSYGETHDYMVLIGAGCTAPTVDLGPDKNICTGSSVVLDAGAFTDAEYTWSNGATTQTTTINTPGTYWVSVSTGINCVDTDTIQVGSSAPPSGIGINVVNNSPSFEFYVASPLNVNSYVWNYGDGSPTETGANVSKTYNSNGNYTVTVDIGNDCDTIRLSQTINVSGASLNTLRLNADVLKLYPNPTASTFVLENTSQYKMKAISITNVLGQTVLTQKVDNNGVQNINVANLTSGLYHVLVEFEEGVVTRKLEVLK